ncbi:MAG: beta-ketoacyl-ACP synthase III [Pseudomonadota bacterium]
MSKTAVISSTGLFTPSESISNEELVACFNQYVDEYNITHQDLIEKGERIALQPSSAEFIEKASGIKSRYVVDKKGILNPQVMAPKLQERSNDEPSVMCEMAVKAAEQALEKGALTPEDIDMVIVAASNMQRPYPAMAIEVQQALGIQGFAFDMNVACSSATFGIKTAVDAVKSDSAKRVLMVNPEICSGHLNFRDRDSHFIFGDVATAVIIESTESVKVQNFFEIVDCHLVTQFSNNIRNNFGFLNRTHPETRENADKLFIQQGRKVFKEVVPLVSQMLLSHIEKNNISMGQLKRLWLHQANLSMNQLISKRVLGREANLEEAPVVLDEYANTSSAGSIIAFNKHGEGLRPGDFGIICSFGAGYSAGSIIVKQH